MIRTCFTHVTETEERLLARVLWCVAFTVREYCGVWHCESTVMCGCDVWRCERAVLCDIARIWCVVLREYYDVLHYESTVLWRVALREYCTVVCCITRVLYCDVLPEYCFVWHLLCMYTWWPEHVLHTLRKQRSEFQQEILSRESCGILHCCRYGYID